MGVRAQLGICTLGIIVACWSASAQTATTTVVDPGSAIVGLDPSHAIVGGTPAVAYYDQTNADLKFARNAAADGSGAWAVSTVDSAGAVGLNPSLAVVNGTPGIAYYDASNGDLKFARNSAADGSGTWTIVTIDTGGDVGFAPSLFVLVATSNPAISYHDRTNQRLKFARSSSANGSAGSWTTATLDTGSGTGFSSSLTCMFNTNPAIAYYDSVNGDLKFIRATASDGSTWAAPVIVDSAGSVGKHPSLIIGGSGATRVPVISYFDTSNSDIKLARNSATDGTGTWTITTIDTGNISDQSGSMAMINGTPAVTYHDGTANALKFARNTAANGSGTWTVSTVEANPADVGTARSLVSVAAGNPAIAYYDTFPGRLKFARSSDLNGGSGTWSPTVADFGGPVGDVGRFASQAIINGSPAIAYYDATNQRLKFARNSNANGTGTWTISTVTHSGNLDLSLAGVTYCSLGIADGFPIIAFDKMLFRNSAADGSGVWEEVPIAGLAITEFKSPSLATIAGKPSVAFVAQGELYFAHCADTTGTGEWQYVGVANAAADCALTEIGGLPVIAAVNVGELNFYRNSAADGSGNWSRTLVDYDIQGSCSIARVNGFPAVSYLGRNGELKYARSSSADGAAGTWTITTLQSLNIGEKTSLAVVSGVPSIAYTEAFFDGTNNIHRLWLATNSVVDGSGTWTRLVASAGTTVGFFNSLVTLPNGLPAVAHCDIGSGDLLWTKLTFHEIAVEAPLGSEIADNASFSAAAALGYPQTFTLNIRNYGVGENLTGFSVTKDGANASEFTIILNATSPVAGPFGSSPLMVQFNPASAGTKTATLHIASNDADENPYDINITASALSFTQDTDGDGMNDASEFQLASLGFNWQVAQPQLVSTLSNNIGKTGIVQSLYVNDPLISKNSSTGQFKLTIGVQKTTNLSNAFAPFPMSAPQTSINANGELEFQFSANDPAAFFRLEAR